MSRQFVRSAAAPVGLSDVFGTVPGEVAVGVVADSLRRSRIQVDVGVFGAGRAGAPVPRAVSQENH